MKTKKSDFILSHFILVFFIVLISLFIQSLLIENFDIHNIINTFVLNIIIALFFLSIYKVFSKSLFTNIFETEKNLDNKIKKTLHELNTPVATILLNTNMLKKTTIDDKSLNKLSRIEQSCAKLLELYDDMEYSIKKEIEKIDTTTFSLKKTILEVKDNYNDLLNKSNLYFYIDIDEKITIKTDKKGFIQAISNLVSNAIKYNKSSGFIKIYFKNNTLYIEDNGVGIDPKNLFLVFDSFYQENIQNRGFGLGLSMVKDFCDNNKISININSKEQKYTIVSLDIQNIMV